MGNPLRRSCLALFVLIGMLVAASLPAQDFRVDRLDADPVPAEVLVGALDSQFAAVEGQAVFETSRQPRWWRLTATRDVPTAQAPQLVLISPYLTQVEVWTPGEVLPQQRALYGPHADLQYSTRALVTALPRGLAAGETIYLRLRAPTSQPMPVAVEPMSVVHAKDLRHVALRTAIVVTMIVLAVLALGFRVWGGEASYTFLLLTLLAQMGYLTVTGGELQLLPLLSEAIDGDPRVGRLLGLAALLASNHFLSVYLNLRERQPRMMQVMRACNAVLGLLLIVTLATPADIVAVIANVVLMIVTTLLFVASLIGTIERQRPARFVLLAWLPMFVLIAWRVAELQGWIPTSEWLLYAFPGGFAVAGLVLMVGLADGMQQLRRDRDRVSQLAMYDTLTGALSRTAIEERLRDAIREARSHGKRLSVVFFDIDRFKHINDEHGHRVGDEYLRIIVLRARNRLRVYDTCGRYGGDEILVILPDTGLREAIGVAENLRAAVNCRPLSIDGRLFNASLSLGVAELAADEEMAQLVERADVALYASKSAGRDRVSGHAVATA